GGAVAIHLGGGEAVAVFAEIDVVALDGEVGVELPADDALDQVALVIEVAAPGLEAAVVAAEVEPGGALGAGPLGHGEGGAEYRQGQSCGQCLFHDFLLVEILGCGVSGIRYQVSGVGMTEGDSASAASARNSSSTRMRSPLLSRRAKLSPWSPADAASSSERLWLPSVSSWAKIAL